MAAAFQRVAAAAPSLRVETPGEDWYVGVGGVPIGPVRLSVIREKVEQGAVDGESLVWREGFEEWQPLRNVPGLRAILDEPRRSASHTPPPDGPHKTASSSSLPRVSATNVPSSSSFGAVGVGVPAPTASHGGALGPALALGNASTGGVALGSAASVPTASPELAPAPLAPSPPPAALGLLVPTAAGAAVASKPTSIAPPPASIAPPSRSDRRKGMHPFAYAMIAMAAVFGGVAAWVLFIKPAPPPVVVVKTVTVEPGLNSAPPPPPSSIGEPAPSASVAVDPKTGQPNPGIGGPRPPVSVASAQPGDAPLPNAGSFDNGVSGPSNGPSTPENGGGNGKLSEGEIQGVVSRNQSRVRRACWQPALDASSGAGAKSARVSTTITISPTGSVSSVNASGAENFPGLASCVGGAIRGWTFPKSDGSTTVNVPFSFNAQ